MDTIKKDVSLEAVKAQFCTEDKSATLETIRERLDEVMNIELAAEMLQDIGEDMDKQIKANGLDLSPIEKMLWAVKEAFIFGALDMAEKMMLVADMGYEALAEEGADV